MEKFYIVAKFENGWKANVGIAYESIDEARAAIERFKSKGMLTGDCKISKKLPIYVGGGRFALNASDIID